MAITYEPIATTTLGSASTSITFSSIPGTYTDLRLVLVMNGSSATLRPRFYFNTDTGTNYSYVVIRGNGTAAAAEVSNNDNRILFSGSVLNPSTTIPSFYTADIFSYSGATNKTVLCSASLDANGSGGTAQTTGLWRSTAAINQIVITSDAPTYAIGTRATLYGIEAA